MGDLLGSHHLRYASSVKNVQKIQIFRVFQIISFSEFFLIFFYFFENPYLDLAALFFKFKKKSVAHRGRGAPQNCCFLWRIWGCATEFKFLWHHVCGAPTMRHRMAKWVRHRKPFPY